MTTFLQHIAREFFFAYKGISQNMQNRSITYEYSFKYEPTSVYLYFLRVERLLRVLDVLLDFLSAKPFATP